VYVRGMLVLYPVDSLATYEMLHTMGSHVDDVKCWVFVVTFL
jgi:hypothetical protein